MWVKRKAFQVALLSLLFLVFSGYQAGLLNLGPGPEPAFPEVPPFLEAGSEWVDSVMGELSLEERIAQMIMIYGYSNLGPQHEHSVSRQISRYGIGGILFFQGEPVAQARLTNRYQAASRVPLLIAMDGENGLGMRLQNTLSYPSMMTLGAITDPALIYRTGAHMADQFRRLGVHMNLAPVADINNNPFNPVIGTRSFGSDRENVAGKVVSLMKGMQDHGLLVAAKHYPGHGDTGTDSHRALPVIPHDSARLDSVELYPFRRAIERGLTGVMVGHLHVPALDPLDQRPTTLSGTAIQEWLKEKMGFRGLVITDALNMKGISTSAEPGQLEVEAVEAGNDILLMPSDVDKAIRAIRRAVRQGFIQESRIDESCRKILHAKYWCGLQHRELVKTHRLEEELNHHRYYAHYRELVAHSLTLVRNRGDAIPLKGLQSIRLATVHIGLGDYEEMVRQVDLYLQSDHFQISPLAGASEWTEMAARLKSYNTILINVMGTSPRASRNYGITRETARFVEQLDTTALTILNVAGYPYALGPFSGLEQMDAVVLSYNDDLLYQQLTLQAIFGGISLSGRLPVSGGELGEAGEGVSTGPPVRFSYGYPEDAALHPDTLLKMEPLITEAIRKKAIPGCVVLVARHGKVVWHKAYGTHTYQRRRRVETSDLYDLASITKVAGPLAALMRLRDQGKFHEDSTLGSYAAVPDSFNKAGLLVSDILTHQAGLIPWIPFYYKTLEPLDTSRQLISQFWTHTHPLKLGPDTYLNRNVKYVDGCYRKSWSPGYPYQVAEDLFMRRDLRDSIYQWVFQSELISREYRYSGLGFFIFHRIIEETTDTLMYPYLWNNFYAPLGAHTLGYRPLKRFPPGRIVPTENDLFYRRQLLRGHVHDQSAAMMGGVSGNAGLFSNANDLAKMMQMYLNFGTYGGRRFIDSTTLAHYSSPQHPVKVNRRGLGFDRPVTWEEDEGPACNSASEKSFGHSGFTGTLAWVDPVYDLLFIFLSNRVHPDQANDKLIEMNVRTALQQAVYDALEQ